jgi:ABC-2 type transport system permease protein
LVMEDMLGAEHVQRFLKNELDGYLGDRGTEAMEELPLVRVEDQGYVHYNKGALAMYFLRNEVGEAPVNRAIQSLIRQFAFKPAPYPTSAQFIGFLRAEVGPDAAKQQLITDLFEKITLYDAKTTAATKVKLPNGGWQVTLTVDAKKLYADGQGNETPAPMLEPWEIGVFTKKPEDEAFTRVNILAFERRSLRSGVQQVVVTLPPGLDPAFAGIDPYTKRIDRNSSDNIIAVTAAAIR